MLHVRAYIAPPFRDAAHRFHQEIGCAGLAQIATSAGVDRPAGVDPVLVHAEHQYARLGSARNDSPEDFNAADPGQCNIEHDDIRFEFAVATNRLRRSRRFADDDQGIVALQQAAIALAYHGVIVDRQHRDLPACRGSHDGGPLIGSEEMTLKPAPHSLTSVIDPPRADTRSRIPSSPRPVCGALRSAPQPLSAMRSSMHCPQACVRTDAIRISDRVAWEWRAMLVSASCTNR